MPFILYLIKDGELINTKFLFGTEAKHLFDAYKKMTFKHVEKGEGPLTCWRAEDEAEQAAQQPGDTRAGLRRSCSSCNRQDSAMGQSKAPHEKQSHRTHLLRRVHRRGRRGLLLLPGAALVVVLPGSGLAPAPASTAQRQQWEQRQQPEASERLLPVQSRTVQDAAHAPRLGSLKGPERCLHGAAAPNSCASDTSDMDPADSWLSAWKFSLLYSSRSSSRVRSGDGSGSDTTRRPGVRGVSASGSSYTLPPLEAVSPAWRTRKAKGHRSGAEAEAGTEAGSRAVAARHPAHVLGEVVDEPQDLLPRLLLQESLVLPQLLRSTFIKADLARAGRRFSFHNAPQQDLAAAPSLEIQIEEEH
ncbi:Glutamate 5-kinase [Frankliniella fusca]|uniref:Glutamate 5-kinase n=1 Tax=Frankliniella fusca TaxID=407009 RepID=A0AAE1HVQ4_9NEOP|nr:Glutamate 5-kinase [Frankliniella fusca]